ncbi:MAG: FGGY family carbohydrate kinase [Kiloniellales bacterium]
MLYLGIDVGTTAVKAAAFSPEGERQAVYSLPTETLSPHPGWSEQDMDGLWELVCQAIVGVMQQVDGSTIAAIGVAGQGDGFWALDQDLRPARNGVLWNDQRAHAIVQRWNEDGTAAVLARASRTAIWAGTSAPVYRWICETEPEEAARIAHVCNLKDWVGLCLTGNLATDLTEAAIPFLDYETLTYVEAAFERCGLPELRRKVLEPRRSEERLGGLGAAAAARLGLASGIPVAVGLMDLPAMHVGAGLNRPGDGLLVLGTTAIVSVVSAPAPPKDKPVGATVLHPKGDVWMVAQAPQSGASALDWFCTQYKETFPKGAEDAAAVAQAVPPGSHGVLFMPFLTGERAPFVEPEASGAFLGMTATTTAADMARAVMEGVAFSLRHCLDEAALSDCRNFVVAGGGARSALWRQILADVMGVTVRFDEDGNLGLWGAALIGAGAAGLADPYATQRQLGASLEQKPSAADKAVYDRAYRRYLEAVEALKPTWRAQAVVAAAPGR